MNKAERLNQALIFLQEKRQFQLQDLMDTFSISKRTALRDVQELEAMGLALYSESGRNGGYHILKQTPLMPIYFSLDEIQAIFFALKALKVVSSTPFKKSFNTVQQKLFQTMSLTRQESVEKILEVVRYHNVAPIDHIENLEYLLKTILDGKAIFFNQTIFQIYELFYRNGIWFASGYDFEKKAWKIYRCDLMKNAIIAEKHPPLLSRSELENTRDALQSAENRTPFRCLITPLGKEMFQKNNYPHMHLETIGTTTYLCGSYHLDEFEYMLQYLLSMSEQVVIETPDELKNAYVERLEQMVRKYQ